VDNLSAVRIAPASGLRVNRAWPADLGDVRRESYAACGEEPGAHGTVAPVIRLAVPDDAAALLALQQRLDRQSAFMLLEPDERQASPDPVRLRLASQTEQGSFDLVAPVAGDDRGLVVVAVAGWLAVEVMAYRRAAHGGYVVLGVDAQHSGRGLGGALLEAAAQESTRRGLTRLELTVMSDNLRALGLYLRHGYQVEGLRRQALRRGGTLVDEYLMARLLPR